jgi:hypothetical protein
MFLPNMQVELSVATTVFGVAASKHISGRYWTFTLVVCMQCGCTQTFTTNGPQLAQWVPGANSTTVPVR